MREIGERGEERGERRERGIWGGIEGEREGGGRQSERG